MKSEQHSVFIFLVLLGFFLKWVNKEYWMTFTLDLYFSFRLACSLMTDWKLMLWFSLSSTLSCAWSLTRFIFSSDGTRSGGWELCADRQEGAAVVSGDGIQRGPRVQEQVGEAVRPLLVAAARPARRQLFLPRLRLLLFRAAAGRRGPVAQLPDPGGRHQGPAAGAGFSKVHPRRLLRLGTSSVDPPSPSPLK